MKGGIRTYLLANAAIAALIATRCYSSFADVSTVKPYIVLSLINRQIQNLINSSLDIYEELWQVDVIADTDMAAEVISELIVTRLNIADRVEMGSYTVYNCSLDSIDEDVEESIGGGIARDARKILTFRFLRDRTATT